MSSSNPKEEKLDKEVDQIVEQKEKEIEEHAVKQNLKDTLEQAHSRDGVSKTLNNIDAQSLSRNVPDIQLFGNPNSFKLLCKSSSQREGWMKSTKCLEIEQVGCIVQVTTQQKNLDGTYSVAEALTFVPGVCVEEKFDDTDTVVERYLVHRSGYLPRR